MNILRLTNEQVWELRGCLAAHSDNHICSSILELIFTDVPKVKEFDTEVENIIADKDCTTEDMQDWQKRLDSWLNEEQDGNINRCSKCGDYAVVKQNTEIHCYKCNDNVVSASSYEEAVKKWNEKNDGYVFVLDFARNSTPNITYL